jgi:hypothetical protein
MSAPGRKRKAEEVPPPEPTAKRNRVGSGPGPATDPKKGETMLEQRRAGMDKNRPTKRLVGGFTRNIHNIVDSNNKLQQEADERKARMQAKFVSKETQDLPLNKPSEKQSGQFNIKGSASRDQGQLQSANDKPAVPKESDERRKFGQRYETRSMTKHHVDNMPVEPTFKKATLDPEPRNKNKYSISNVLPDEPAFKNTTPYLESRNKNKHSGNIELPNTATSKLAKPTTVPRNKNEDSSSDVIPIEPKSKKETLLQELRNKIKHSTGNVLTVSSTSKDTTQTRSKTKQSAGNVLPEASTSKNATPTAELGNKNKGSSNVLPVVPTPEKATPAPVPTPQPAPAPALPKFKPYTARQVPLLYSPKVVHRAVPDPPCNPTWPAKIPMGHMRGELHPNVSPRLRALEIITGGYHPSALGLDPKIKRFGPDLIIDDVDLYVHQDKVHVACSFGLVLVPDYLSWKGVPENQQVRFNGLKPAWAKAVQANAQRRTTIARFQPAPGAVDELDLLLYAPVELYHRETGYLTTWSTHPCEWAYGRAGNKVGWFPYACLRDADEEAAIRWAPPAKMFWADEEADDREARLLYKEAVAYEAMGGDDAHPPAVEAFLAGKPVDGDFGGPSVGTEAPKASTKRKAEDLPAEEVPVKKPRLVEERPKKAVRPRLGAVAKDTPAEPQALAPPVDEADLPGPVSAEAVAFAAVVRERTAASLSAYHHVEVDWDDGEL